MTLEGAYDEPMKLLLHACCGPCSLEPVRILAEAGHDITIAYLNSNIAPASEYEHRIKTLLEWAKSQNIPVIEGPYEPATWQNAIKQNWDGTQENRADRCRACYRIRLEELARYAYEHGFEGIGTTLTVSPYQYTDIINEELERAAAPYEGLSAVFQDFREFYPQATIRSRELGMYRQNYCGCAYSDAEAAAERAERKAARKAAKAKEKREKLMNMRTDDFDYNLPEELIAQEPAAERDGCRMLVMKRQNGALHDEIFRDIINHLKPGDLIVANETRVMPARLLGTKRNTGGQAEVFLLRERFDVEPKHDSSAIWEVLVRPGKRLKPGTGAMVDFPDKEGTVVLSAEIIDWVENAEKGERLARLTTTLPSLDEALHRAGHTPLPPYIKNYAGDEELYQTVFSREERSAAAPTAGLHFTPELIERIKAKGIDWETVHLEVGLDTFRIVDEEFPKDHQIHTERYTVPEKTVEAIKRTKANGGRVIAIGTTSVRSLESAWDAEAGEVLPRDREATSLFILPGYEFHVVDAMVTNFHVPRSTLMMLVSAFSGRDNIMKAYRHAIKHKYRMLSFGDAMFIE